MGKRRSVIPLCPVPCREDQFNEISHLVQQNIIENGSKCLYVSGVPGTGKTLIVSTVLEELEKNSGTPNFNNVYINGLSLGTNPDKIWKVLWEHISEEKLSSKKALAKLGNHFATLDIIPTVLVIDELDQLMDKRQAVLYQLLEWTTNPDTKLTFIGIFNTMNLPENLVNRNASRMGLSRVQFPPYDASQLQTIVESWLKKSKRKTELNVDALSLLSKKVAAVSGDARRALQIAKRTVEKIEQSGVKGVHAVNAAFQELFTTPKVETIRNCSTLEKCLLEGVVSEVKRTGDEEIAFGRVESGVVAQNQYEGKCWSRDNITAALMRLIALRLVSLESNDILITASTKISLNVASEDVKYALDKDRDNRETYQKWNKSRCRNPSILCSTSNDICWTFIPPSDRSDPYKMPVENQQYDIPRLSQLQIIRKRYSTSFTRVTCSAPIQSPRSSHTRICKSEVFQVHL